MTYNGPYNLLREEYLRNVISKEDAISELACRFGYTATSIRNTIMQWDLEKKLRSLPKRKRSEP